MIRTIVICSILLFTGCAKITFDVPAGDIRHAPSDSNFEAGFHAIDITPSPLTSMAGFGNDIGKMSRGHLGKLYIKTTYIKDRQGNYLLFVASDLWAFPQGLGDKTLELLKKRNKIPIKIARENVIFSATHTHTSHGNYATAFGYNFGSSTVKGFNSETFDMLALYLCQSIEGAINNTQAAKIEYGTANVYGLSRNRSLLPFLNNEPKDIAHFTNLAQQVDLSSFVNNQPECLADREAFFYAIDPTLTTIIISNLDNGLPISIINNFSLHPIAMGSNSPLNSADVFGRAAQVIENHLIASTNMDLHNIVSFCNGSEGDLSPNWHKQGIVETKKLGEKLGVEVIKIIDGETSQIDGPLSAKLDFGQIDKVMVSDSFEYDLCLEDTPRVTSNDPYPGKSIIFGSEDGRVTKDEEFNECTPEEEGNTSIEVGGPHCNKDAIPLAALAVSSAPKKEIPVGMYDIGPLRIITMPGETTVALGQRIKQTARSSSYQHPILISLANEYVSYFTTPKEYELQHYEGASTLYGYATGGYFVDRVQRIKEFMIPSNSYSGERKYQPHGIIKGKYDNKKANKIINDNGITKEQLFQNIGFDQIPKHIVQHWGPTIPIDTSNINVHIEIKINGQWQILQVLQNQDNHSWTEPQSDLHSFNIINATLSDVSGWTSIWIIPDGTPESAEIRFAVKHNKKTWKGKSIKYESNDIPR